MRIIGWTAVAYATAMLAGATALVASYMLTDGVAYRPFDYSMLVFVAAVFLLVGFPFFALPRLFLYFLGGHSLLAFGGVAAAFGVVAGMMFGLPDAMLWDAGGLPVPNGGSSLEEIIRANPSTVGPGNGQ